MSDEEILKISYRNPSRFGELFDRYNKRFFNIAKKTLRSNQDAEDVVQETFIKIYKYGKKFAEAKNEEKKFLPWANTILKNCLADQINKYKFATVEISEEMESSVPDLSPRDDLGEKNYINFIFEKIDKTSAEILKLRYVLGKSFKQIGKILNIQSGTARVRAIRARKVFIETYKEYNAYGK